MPARINYAKLDLMDALDLATLIEQEAVARYTLFSQQLGHRHAGDAGSVFRSMVVNEEKHGNQLAERRKKMFGTAPVRVRRDAIFDVEAPDVGAARLNMSALKALEVALDSEKKAFAFYDDALGHITNAEVKALFRELRDEETEHVQMLEKIIAGLPPSAALDVTNVDDDD